ncbi:unnamed protein product [Knipowitschia caucasica]
MDFSCPVCLEVYKDPVLLPCSHSFCKACLQNCWGEDGTRQCPVCKRCSFVRDPPCNLILKNLCDAFAQQLSLKQPSQAEAICPHHKEKLQLFCLDHQQPVCLVCRDSRAHHEHKFRPINEMAQDYREQLQKSLLPLQDRLQETSDVIQHWYQTGEYIKQEGDRTEKLIQKEINKMRDFLQKEEQERVQAVRTEVQQKISLMEQNVAALSEEMETLSNSIRQTQEELKASDVAFLQKYSGAVRRVQEAPLEVIPLMPSGGLVDVAKHLGNLGFNIWNQMKDLVSYTPVVLDPNTAFRSLFVSDDLCSVHCANRETELPWVPENPERFIKYVKVLGNEEFTTGKHRWEVDVQEKGNWAVGVITKSTPCIGDIPCEYWTIWFKDDHYSALAPPHIDTVLTLKNPLQRIRVDLDMDRRRVSFSDAFTNTHIHTFYYIAEKVFPFINTIQQNQITISPSKVMVQFI